MWQEIIDGPLPENQELRCTLTAMLHYAKSVALLRDWPGRGSGRGADAFEAAVAARPRITLPVQQHGQDILAIARAMLAGELEYRNGHSTPPSSTCAGRSNSKTTLPYDEPWGWMQPTRHAYGALLLEQGHIEEAEAVYRRRPRSGRQPDPRACQHPENVWALHGYHECLLRLGNPPRARMVKQRLDLAARPLRRPDPGVVLLRMSASPSR